MHNMREASRVRSSLSDIALILRRLEERPEHHIEINLIFILRVGEGNLVFIMVWNYSFLSTIDFCTKVSTRKCKKSYQHCVKAKIFNPRLCKQISYRKFVS